MKRFLHVFVFLSFCFLLLQTTCYANSEREFKVLDEGRDTQGKIFYKVQCNESGREGTITADNKILHDVDTICPTALVDTTIGDGRRFIDIVNDLCLCK